MLHGIKIQKILNQRNESQDIWQKMKLTKEAIQLADTHQDLEWGFSLRNELMDLENDTSQCIESLHAFNWIIQTESENPGIFNALEVLWKYKWMIHSLRRNYEFSLEQIREIDNDFKERLQQNGYSLRYLYNRYMDDAVLVNNKEEAEKWFKLMKSQSDDDMSNCKACELDSFIDYELAFGDLQQALNMATPLVNKSLSCKSVPLITFANITTKLLDSGEAEEAERFFQFTEQLFASKDKESRHIGTLSEIIYYLAQTRNKRGFEYLNKYNSWAFNAEHEQQYRFFQAAALLCQKLPQSEEVLQLNLHPELPGYRQDQAYQTDELARHFGQEALRIARLFDTRNQNQYYENTTESLLGTSSKAS